MASPVSILRTMPQATVDEIHATLADVQAYIDYQESLAATPSPCRVCGDQPHRDDCLVTRVARVKAALAAPQGGRREALTIW